ncbi:MAG: MBL fold metallo-hydrolase [Candidatus Bathyarchaeota archaeon]|nr:MBL fold metallo-hydrolase [Candidatus Bathyarchaeota archaeon]
MLFERIESEGLAHYSYIIGDGNVAVVIDPRRDCDIYVDLASKNRVRIAHILETHRNEDYTIGSLELANLTDADIWHADSELKYQYGKPVKDGQTWEIERLRIQAMHSPGHTPGSMSYLLHDHDNHPWILFTGDALFAGDVGRVDLLGMDRAEELGKMLYNTIFNKFLPLGDDIIICPAHGAGSVCGSGISKRVWTTLGLERRYNPKLQFDNQNDFVKKAVKELERPPYFRKSEVFNVEGAPILGKLPVLKPLSPDEFEKETKKAIVLDIRSDQDFGAAHIPKSLSIWLDGVPSFAGWFLSYDKPILLVSTSGDLDQATRYLIRLGYDQLTGYLSGGMHSWHAAGKESISIGLVTVQSLCKILDENKQAWILDVRSEEELEKVGEISGAKNIHITQLPNRLDEVVKDREIYIFCGSGNRAMIAASILQNNGWKNITVVLGGLRGWSSTSCPIK